MNSLLPIIDIALFCVEFKNNIPFQFIQGGERTSQSRDQNIEKGYTLRNFLSLRTGKIDFFNTSVVPFRKIASAKCETNFKLVIIAY